MTQPAQQPPQPRSDHAALSVVGDDLLSRIDTGAPQLFHERVRIGKRMPAVGSGLRSGGVLVEMQEAWAGDRRCRGLGAPARRIGEILAAGDRAADRSYDAL